MSKKSDYDEKQKKETLSMLDKLSKKIKTDKFKVRNKGWWHANLGGRMSFHVDVTNMDMEEDKPDS